MVKQLADFSFDLRKVQISGWQLHQKQADVIGAPQTMAIQADGLSHEAFDTIALVGVTEFLFYRYQEPGLDSAGGQDLAVEYAEPPIMAFAEYPVNIVS